MRFPENKLHSSDHVILLFILKLRYYLFFATYDNVNFHLKSSAFAAVLCLRLGYIFVKSHDRTMLKKHVAENEVTMHRSVQYSFSEVQGNKITRKGHHTIPFSLFGVN